MRTLTTLSVLLLSATAQASSVGVSPAWLELETTPGVAATADLSVAVSGAGLHHFHTQVWDWWYDARGGSVFSPPGTRERSAASFLDVSEETVWVSAQRPARLQVRVTPPPWSVGGYYAVVFVEEVIEAPQALTPTVRTASRVAVPVLVGVEGRRAVSVLHVDVTPPDRFSPLELRISIRNDGDRHVKPEVQGVLRGPDGQLVTVAGTDGRFVLPGQERSLYVESDAELAPGTWDFVGMVRLGGDDIMPVHTRFQVEDFRRDGLSAVSTDVNDDLGVDASVSGSWRA